MIKSSAVLRYLKKMGYRFYSGVPCSILKNFLRSVLDDPGVRYINAPRENMALGVASGAYLAGKNAVVLMQNSGLGNIVNALTSFNIIYKVPALMIITWRGFDGKDAPEHKIMGEKTITLLRELDIPCKVLTERYEDDIDWACRKIKRHSVPVALILKDGLIR